MIKEITLKSFSKINLFLSVGRKSGKLHKINSLAQTIDLHDILTIAPAGGIDVACNIRELSGRQNVVFKIAEKIQSLFPVKGVKIDIQKNVPVGAGLGGGSANAAAALIGICKLYDIEMSKNALTDIAGEAGSDVPLFLAGGCVEVGGFGEKIIKRADRAFDGKIIIYKPEISVSTKDAYADFDAFNKKPRLKNIPEKFSLKDYSNDFEPVIFGKYPELAEVKQLMLDNGFLLAGLSGSGSALFGIYRNQENADNFCERIHKKGYKGVIYTASATNCGYEIMNKAIR